MIRETFQVHRICVIVFLKPDRWVPGICMLPSMSERFLCIFSKSGAGMSGGSSICRGRSEAVEGPQFLRPLMKRAMTKAEDSLPASRVEQVLSSVGGDQTPDSWDTPNIQPKNTSSGL